MAGRATRFSSRKGDKEPNTGHSPFTHVHRDAKGELPRYATTRTPKTKTEKGWVSE